MAQMDLALLPACTIFATKVIIYRKNETRKTIIMLEKGLSARSAATVVPGNTAAAMGTVTYTHMTLPTSDLVDI